MSTRVKINFVGVFKQTPDEVVNNVLKVANVNIIDIYPAQHSITLQVNSNKDVSLLTSAEAVDKLYKLNLKVVVPRQHVAAKTVFVNKLTDYFTNRHEQDILDEINKHNDVTAEEVYLINSIRPTNGYFHSIKIKFGTVEDADKVVENGLKLFQVSLKPENIKKERAIEVKQCFRCFQFNHTANKCPSTESKCSVCGDNHNFRNCPNTASPRCVNCREAHIAIANHCPVRKAYIKKLNETEKTASNNNNINNNPSFSQSQSSQDPNKTQANAWIKPPKFQTQIPLSTPEHDPSQQTNQTPNKVEVSIGQAHLTVAMEYAKMKAENPYGNHENFLDIMNDYFIHNNLPPVNMPKHNVRPETVYTPKNVKITTTSTATSPTLPEGIVHHILGPIDPMPMSQYTNASSSQLLVPDSHPSSHPSSQPSQYINSLEIGPPASISQTDETTETSTPKSSSTQMSRLVLNLDNLSPKVISPLEEDLVSEEQSEEEYNSNSSSDCSNISIGANDTIKDVQINDNQSDKSPSLPPSPHSTCSNASVRSNRTTPVKTRSSTQ